jgi:hypothetical protein
MGSESLSQRTPFASLFSPRTRSIVGRKSLRNWGKTVSTVEELEGLA